MTLLLAALFKDRVLLAADGVRTDLEAGNDTVTDKTVVLAPNLLGAKFGYAGPKADALWSDLLSMPVEERSNIDVLLERAREGGRPIYEERRNTFAAHGQGDYGLTLLMAGWDDRRGPGIHWIDFKMGDGEPVSVWYEGSPQVIAAGPDGAQEIAVARACDCLAADSFDAGSWVRQCIAECQALATIRLGFPAVMYSLRRDEKIRFELSETEPQLVFPIT